MDTDREIRIDAKLKGRAEKDPQFAEEMWLYRNPGEDGEKLSMEAIAALLPDTYNISCSVSVVSEFYKWLRLRKRMENAAERASQARYALAQDPNMTPDMLARVGQMVFTAETIEDGNVKAYVELVKLQLQARSLEINARKLKLLEDSAKEAKARLTALTTAAKSNGGLTPETLKQIEEAAGLL
jgi:hypothetical protein